MTKTQQWDLVKEILTNGKVSKKVQSQLEDILAPKTSGGSIYPPKLDEDGNILNLDTTMNVKTRKKSGKNIPLK